MCTNTADVSPLMGTVLLVWRHQGRGQLSSDNQCLFNTPVIMVLSTDFALVTFLAAGLVCHEVSKDNNHLPSVTWMDY